MIVFLLIYFSMQAFSSPILEYKQEITPSDKESVFFINLDSITVHDVSPMLRALCSDCHWVFDHARQRVAVKTTKTKWYMYRRAIRAMDKKMPMVLLNVEIIEVTDIQNETYKQFLSQFSQPMKLNHKQQLSMDIEFLMSMGKASIVSSPRIIGKSGKEARIQVGDKIPYTIYSQNSSSTIRNVQYIDSGIELIITPYVHFSDKIDLDIELNYKTVNGYKVEHASSDVPMFASRATKLYIQATSNSTIIFSGLLDQSDQDTIESVPLLGDIPLLGHLFRRTSKKKKQTDLIYKITPIILN